MPAPAAGTRPIMALSQPLGGALNALESSFIRARRIVAGYILVWAAAGLVAYVLDLAFTVLANSH
jgi:predicted metal-binding membrane protein